MTERQIESVTIDRIANGFLVYIYRARPRLNNGLRRRYHRLGNAERMAHYCKDEGEVITYLSTKLCVIDL